MIKVNKLLVKHLCLMVFSFAIAIASIVLFFILIENANDSIEKYMTNMSITPEALTISANNTYQRESEICDVIPNDVDKVECMIEETEEKDIEESTYYCEWADISLTQDEYELLLTTVYCESGGEIFDAQCMVALVILNMVVDDEFPNNIRDVVYRKNTFEVVNLKDFESRGWTESVEKAVDLALKENNHPIDMLYFRTSHYHTWARDYKKVGKTYFSRRKWGRSCIEHGQ